jgi:hypothetical protein
MALQPQTIENFNNNLNEYINNYVRNNMYVIELTKCCGYGTFITVYKDETLIDVYKKASMHIGTNEIKSLFIITPLNEKIMVPISSLITFRQFLMSQIIDSNNPNMVPIYPMPAHIVYRIYVDDGHCHIHDYH